MRPIDADTLIETVEDHVITVSCCPTADWARGKSQMKDQILEDIRNAPTIGDWINVKDSLPENAGTYITLCAGRSDDNFYSISYYNVEKGEWYDWLHFNYDDSYVEYWMPLPPKPPKENK